MHYLTVLVLLLPPCPGPARADSTAADEARAQLQRNIAAAPHRVARPEC